MHKKVKQNPSESEKAIAEAEKYVYIFGVTLE